MKTAEKITGIIAIFGLVLYFLKIPGGSSITIISFSSLACIYFYLGFLLFNDKTLKQLLNRQAFIGLRKSRTIGTIVSGGLLSITVIGILFRILLWPGAAVMLSVGLIGLAIVTCIAFFKYQGNKSHFYIGLLKRNVIYGGAAITLLLLPPYTILEFKYGNHPDYIEAVKNLDADPHNQELWEKVEEERRKMLENE